MSSSENLSPSRVPRKPSAADSGYDGPSRETSTVLLLDNQEKRISHSQKANARTSSDTLEPPLKPNCSLTSKRETVISLETSGSLVFDSASVSGEHHPGSFWDDSAPIHRLEFPVCSEEASRCKSEPFLLSADSDDSNLPPLTHSLSSNHRPIMKVSSDGRITSNAAPSQPSVVQFTQQRSLVHVTLSSSDSINTFKINITISSPESQSQVPTAACDQLASSHKRMTAVHEEILKRTVKKNTHDFIEQTHFEMLIPFLFEKRLIHAGDSETLGSIPSHKTKGNLFYTVILPRKGKHAYRRLYKCLKQETEHLGHQDLLAILDNALREQQSRQSSSDCTPTEEEGNGYHSHLLNMCRNGPSSACSQKCQVSTCGTDNGSDRCSCQLYHAHNNNISNTESYSHDHTYRDAPPISHSGLSSGDITSTASCVHGDSSLVHRVASGSGIGSLSKIQRDSAALDHVQHDKEISNRNKNRTSGGCCTVL